MASCILFGGAGYIGTFLAQYFLQNKLFENIHIADIKASSLAGTAGISTSLTDVRNEIKLQPVFSNVTWIFNLAAIHREPGHRSEEYFETNIHCAENICNFAAKLNCKNIFFFSSISVYGPAFEPMDEYHMTMPTTPYGISKLTAEYIHKNWREKTKGKLIICRPGVIYGPKDPGNILRMIKAILKGYFFLPVSPSIQKSYGYIYGLLDSVIFAMALPDELFTYNYVEYPTISLGTMIKEIKETLNTKAPIIQVPFIFLYSAAHLVTFLKGKKTPIHPKRVKKIATSTHIIPKILLEKGFHFKYNFKNSLIHWKNISPDDFK